MTNIPHAIFKEGITIESWLQKMLQRHFEPETGSPYWTEKRHELEFDPVKDIRGIEDLKLFGLFDENALRDTPARRFIPNAYKRDRYKDVRVFESGGTMGIPKRIIDRHYRETVAEWFSFCLDRCGFKTGGDWLHFAPSGPHVVGFTTGKIAGIRNGLCHYIDLDPRWIKHCIKNGLDETADEYIDHLVNQALTILRTQEISFLFTTPRLLLRLAEKIPPSETSLQGVVCGGTHVTPDLYMLMRDEILSGIPLCMVYGNTLMGVAPQAHDPGNDEFPRYYPLFPNVILRVVDPADPWRIVDYGERGRVMITVLNEDYFIPNLLERDEGIRIHGNDLCPWDGIADVRPFSCMNENIIEGVY